MASEAATCSRSIVPHDTLLLGPDSACHRVLGIEELCTAILCHLPVRDLLRCRSVSRSLRSTASSNALREALFLEAVPAAVKFTSTIGLPLSVYAFRQGHPVAEH